MEPRQEVHRRQHVWRQFLGYVLAVSAVGCGGPAAGPADTSAATATGATLGAFFDATPAYPGYVWNRNGHPVTPEELGTIAGPAHCGWRSATLLSIGWPVGTMSTSSAEARQYIRDPHGVMRSTLRDRLDLHATLPVDARSTGYTYGPIQIYLSPTDEDQTIYVVGPSATERWPRSDPLTLCS